MTYAEMAPKGSRQRKSLIFSDLWIWRDVHSLHAGRLRTMPKWNCERCKQKEPKKVKNQFFLKTELLRDEEKADVAKAKNR